MMLIKEEGNLVTGNYEVFCHQVNCYKVMGAGIAKQIRDRYPEVYEEYEKREYAFLGAIDWIHTHDGRICVNMYAQKDYGTGSRKTDYIGFAGCLAELEDYLCSVPKDYKVAFPYRIGCGLAGGDWKVVEALLEDFAYRVEQPVYIVYLPNT